MSKICCYSFSEALQALKDGYRVQRSGWNGKGMWLCLISSNSYKLSNPNYTSIPEYDDEPHLLPWVGMKTANNGFVPWLCSQTDMLAEDWVVIENEETKQEPKVIHVFLDPNKPIAEQIAEAIKKIVGERK